MSLSPEPKMSSSVFETAKDLLDRAGEREPVLASLAPTGQKINFNPTSAIDRECQMYMDLLHHGLVGRWFTTNQCTNGEQHGEAKDADVRIDIPMIRLGKALRPADVPEKTEFRFIEDVDYPTYGSTTTNYVLVVQGASGAGLQKVLICQGLKEAGDSIFHEALNGYSVVFCAAILEHAAKFILRLSTRDPEHLLKTVRFSRVPINVERYLVSRRQGFDFRATQMREMQKLTNVDVYKGHLTIGFIN